MSHTFRISDLDQFIAPRTPRESKLARWRTLYAPVDDVHGALMFMVTSAAVSVQLAMYAVDDSALINVLADKMSPTGPAGFRALEITLDLSETKSRGELALFDPATCPLPSTPALATTHVADPRFSLAVGNSSLDKGDWIMHLKHMVIDGVTTMHGSTNWSQSGQREQDNEITVIHDALHAGRCGAHLTTVHAAILSQGYVMPAPTPPAPVGDPANPDNERA